MVIMPEASWGKDTTNVQTHILIVVNSDAFVSNLCEAGTLAFIHKSRVLDGEVKQRPDPFHGCNFN